MSERRSALLYSTASIVQGHLRSHIKPLMHKHVTVSWNR